MAIDNENLEMVELLLENKVTTFSKISIIYFWWKEKNTIGRIQIKERRRQNILESNAKFLANKKYL